jgi:hypothetical protein
MRWTRVSFFYLMTYLGLGGLGLVAVPDLALRLLGSTANDSLYLARFIGAFMIALSIIVIQIVRHRVEVMYRTTLIARIVLVTTALWLYIESRDLLFLSISGIVGVGMLLTMFGLIADRGTRTYSVLGRTT